MPEQGLVRGMSGLAAICLAAGNIIASGIYVIPASLAEQTGPIAIFAWVLNAAAFFCLAVVFGDLGGAFPVSGGPQAFVEKAFGRLSGAVVGFLYWVSCVTTAAAFATGIVGYMTVYAPSLVRPLPAFFMAQALLWGLTLVNVVGVRAGGRVQTVTTLLKILPLLVLAAALLLHTSPTNAVPFAPHGVASLLPAMALVAWIFLGAESVTVPGDEIAGGGRAIRRAAYVGYWLAAVVYLIMAVALTWGLPAAQIAGSSSPLAVAAAAVLGPWGSHLLTIGALVSLFGALNGWLLVTGRLPYAAARIGCAPRFLGRAHERFGTPSKALWSSTLLASVLSALYFHHTLLHAYNFIVLISTATALVAIGATCLAYPPLVRRERELFSPRQRRRAPFIGVAGVLVVGLMIAGTGWLVVGLTAATTLVAVLGYAWLMGRQAKTGSNG